MLNIEEFYLFSSNYKLAQKLLSLGKLKAIYFESKHINQNIFNLCKLYDIKMFLADSIEELDVLVPVETKNALAISYGIGLFFKNRHMEKFKYGIWNIHPGKLPDNRGRHPISWSYLNNEREFWLSIHKINENIDAGELIAEFKISRDINDTQKDIITKIDNLIEDNLIETCIKNYFLKKTKKLPCGNYNKSLAGQFDNINPASYTSRELFNIFKSQLFWGSVCVNNKTYCTCNYFCEQFDYPDCDIITCKDNIKMALKFSHNS